MSLTRTTDTDDSGGGTDGTIHNNAWLQAVYDVVDGRWTENTTTSTGTQNNFSYSEADHLRLNNASLLTLTGILAPAAPVKPGKRLILSSIGAGQVDLNDQSASSNAANRIVTGSGVTLSLAPGKGRALLVYDAVTAMWRVQNHDQGAFIAYTPTWAGGAPAILNGTLAGKYYVRGRECQFSLVMAAGSTTTFGGATVWTFTLPFTADESTRYAMSVVSSVGGTLRTGSGFNNGSTTTITLVSASGGFNSTTPGAWANGDFLLVTGRYFLA